MLAHPSSAPSSANFSAAGSAPRTLADLDERLAVASSGVVLARAPRDVADSLLAHAARRVRAVGRVAVLARPHESAPLWREVASRLSVGKLPCDPTRCAEQIATAAFLRRAVIVAPLPRAGSWDRAVAVELAVLPSAPLVVFVCDDDAANDVRGDRYDVTATLDAEGKRRWWDAIAEEAHAMVPSDDLAALEGWWSAVKRASIAPPRAEAAVPAEGAELFTMLALAGKPWPAADLESLGGDGRSVAALVSAGAVYANGAVAIMPAWSGRARAAADAASGEARSRMATLLTGVPDPEPWAFARAAELWAHAGADAATIEAADRAIATALSAAEDPLARREIGARWMAAIESLSAVPKRELLVRTAERALTAGEPDEAHRCAKSAAAIAGDDARVLILLGRASTALGDLVAAKVALERARETAKGDAELEATVLVELSEVAYLKGEIAAARAIAHQALDATTLGPTKLRARNTLGKLLLAESKWEDADRHFVEDGLLASGLSDPIGELRARMNRAIALLSKGLLDEARVVFEGVLEEGERIGEPRACAYALSNLGLVALRRHEYGAALGYMERTIKLLHVMRDRMAAARSLANLASLREELGLFEHAEHVLSFGRRSLGTGMPAQRALHFGMVAARIALSRGRTLEAQREIELAIANGEDAGNRDLHGQAYRVAVRIALEDGDLPRASKALARARELAAREDARAEVALLHAMYERASGNEDVAPAQDAIMRARAAGSDITLREAHVLLGEMLRASGNPEAARAQIAQAANLRDKMAESLSGEVKSAFLARRDIVHLERLRAQLVEPVRPPQDSITEDEAPRSVRSLRPTTAVPREIVGDDPAVRGLLLAIKKVARSNSTVLIRGESGTGKELVAEALHRASDRANGPLVTVNCAALVETLLLSELFGHEKGAFTGAFARRRGRFELAEGGTLFLDEIGDISPRTQVALLRVLQERTFERVGGTTAIRANVRIVCATHRDLRAMVDRGEFREDLYYRLRGITLEMPPLRARMGDLPRISEHLLRRIAAERGEVAKSLSGDAIELLSRHKWPGNVRELENALRAASLFAEGDVITASDLVDNVDDLRAVAQAPAPSRASVPPPTPVGAPDTDATLSDTDVEIEAPLPTGEANATSVAYAQVRGGGVSLSDMKRQIERDCIARALAETKGNITRAAALLGMKRPRLSQLVKQYGLAAVSSEGQ